MVTDMKHACAVLLTLALWWVAIPAAAEVGLPPGVQPVSGPVVTVYDPPAVAWGSGHRGVDVASTEGAVVVAAAAGTVTFAGLVAGRGVVVVDHGSVRTTYEPVSPEVSVGQAVARGQPIGRLLAGHPGCPVAACLHWGLKSADDYLDPMLLLRTGQVRLLPSDATAPTPPPVATGVAVSSAGYVRPADGPTTSPFGMRLHPVLGVWKLHDGTDIGAPCGSVIRAAAAGVVISVVWNDAYGNRLLIDHGVGPNGHTVTAYNHAQSYSVRVGDVVQAGQPIGAVGTTGWSTGCHLHAQAWVDDVLIDPAGLW